MSESAPYGEMSRRARPYAAKRRELTPAMPMRGLAMPGARRVCAGTYGEERAEGRTFVEREEAFVA